MKALPGLKFFLYLLFAAALAGCLNDADDAPTNSSAMAVVPSLGLIRNADVVILNLDGTPVAGASGTLNAQGEVELSYPNSLTGPIIVEVRGNATAEYFDEADGTFKAFPAGERLRTYLTQPKASVGVTPLTELAASLIAATGGTPDAERIQQVTEQVRQALAPDVADITAPPTLVSDTTGAGDLADDDGGRYAAVLAALAELGSSGGSPALNVLEQLRLDLADGNIDGQSNGTPIANLVYNAGSFTNDLTTAINSVVAALGTTALQNRTFTAPSSTLPGSSGGDGGSGDGGSGDGGSGDGGDSGNTNRVCLVGEPSDASVPALVSGESISFVVDFIVQGAAVDATVGEVIEFIFSSDGSLQVDGEVWSSDPYLCGGNSAETNWYNSTDGELLSLSIVNEEINEINFAQGDPLAFAAQLIVFTDDGVPGDIPNLNLVTALAGTYNVSSESTHTSGTITIGPDGSVNFDADLMFTAQQIQQIFDRTSIAHEPRVQINYGASDSDDSFRIYLDPQDLTQVIRIDFSGPGGSRSALISADSQGGGDTGGGDNGGGGVAEDLGQSNGLTGIFGGQPMINTNVTDFRGPPLDVSQGIFDVGEQGDPFTANIRLFNASASAVGVQQNCAANGVPSLNVQIDGNFYSGSPFDGNGASCTVVITEATATTIRGTFSGTLVAFGQDPLVVTNGAFQYQVTPFEPAPEAQVALDFEGLTPGGLNEQGDGTTDRGATGTWSFGGEVVDRTASPLTYDLDGQSLDGGDRAVRLQSFNSFANSGRRLTQVFQDEVFISFLVRVEGDPGASRSRITLGNPSVYIGLDTNNATDQFVVSLADADSTKAFSGGTIAADQTYLVVGRLYKNAPLDDDYNRFDLWVNPGADEQDLPHATAERNRGTGSLLSLSAIGFAGVSQFSPAFYDRIRIADSWSTVLAAADGSSGGSDNSGGGDTPVDNGDTGAGILGTSSGVTALVDGERVTMTADFFMVGGPPGTFTAGANNGLGISASVVGSTAVGTNQCGSGTAPNRVSLNVMGTVYIPVSLEQCTLEIVQGGTPGSDSIIGTFSGEFVNQNGPGEISVSDGYFQALVESDTPDSDAGAFEGNGVTGSIDGTAITYQRLSVITGNLGVVTNAAPASFDFAVTFGSGANGMLTVEAIAANLLDKWRLIFPEEVGTHSCSGENSAALQYIDISGGQLTASATADGGNCSIEVLQVGAIYEANFSGSMVGAVVANSGQTFEVTGGYLFINTQVANP